MFLGHFGLGFAAKKLNAQPSLGTYFIAAQFLDLVWPTLLLRGIEKVQIDPGNTAFTPLNFVHYPYSHSLVSAICWSLIFGLIYFLLTRNGRTTILVAILVLSHWILDFVTHRPDLPLSPWTDMKFGLGLWNNKIATLIIELIIFVGGIIIYARTTIARSNAGHFALWSFATFMLTIYFFNAFGPAPDSVDSIAILGLSQWLLIGWGYWIDYTRENRLPGLAIT
jgi:membrane-bound metal-dependent hydrolase YbcI (DUF457 family)